MKISRFLLPIALGALALSLTVPMVCVRAQNAGEKTVPIPNGNFEQGLSGWTIPATEGMTTLSREQAASGTQSLKIVDSDTKNGSDATGGRIPVRGAGLFHLRGKAFPVSGSGLGIYVRVLDKDGKLIRPQDEFQRGAPVQTVGKWNDFSIPVYTTDDTAFLEVWIHSYGAATVTAYLDDLHFTDAGAEALKPPFPSTYKIKPAEKERLTAADVVGPDGIVYPDWRYAGIPGGIPNVDVKARLEDFGGRADDGRDDSDALEKAAAELARRGGGALALGAGTYHLDRPVLITGDSVVLRGAGADKTKVLFRYAGPASGVDFYRPLVGSTVDASTWIEVHAPPKDLRALRIEVGDAVLARTTYYPQHWGGTFSLRTNGGRLLSMVPGEGPRTLRAIAEYADGTKKVKEIPITVSRAAVSEPARVPDQIGAIMFAGPGPVGPQLKLAQDGKRGDKQIVLENAEGLAAGDRIRLKAPATERWNKLVRNACPWGEYRRYEFVVEGVDGNRVRLNQPLRLEFPVVDGSFVQEVRPLRRSGIENLYLEQTNELWTSGVFFSNAWECWARGVTVKKAGRHPVYMVGGKWNEIRDCTFDDAWYKGGGGTAYVGWELGCDNLMENVTTYKMRHAPLFQWAASGNVIRNGTFYDSDAQWHSGWTNENLFENCVIGSTTTGNGGYGFGMWASPPEDEAHGPNGPRNVIYNCDVTSGKTGLWMGGMNENWIVAYNRFDVKSGYGVFAKTASFDHIVKGNTFVLGDPKQAVLYLATPDCIGVEMVDNRIFGGAGQKLSAGGAKPAVDTGNQILTGGSGARPQPAVPSIFEWQRKNRRELVLHGK